MAEVNLAIHGRAYDIACDDGQEQRVLEVGRYVDTRAREIAQAGAANNETHLLVLTALVLADEAVSALDLSTKVRIVDLFKELAAQVTLLFVSHDLGVVAALCEEIVILERGRIVESGRTHEILKSPQHPYTRALLASVPRMPELTT